MFESKFETMATIKEPFLLCENPESMPGPGMIISTESPYWIGKVYQFKTEEEFSSFSERVIARNFYKCRNYRIGVLIIGSLEYIGVIPGIKASYDQPFRSMADFYLENKILKNAGYFKRYKEEEAKEKG